MECAFGRAQKRVEESAFATVCINSIFPTAVSMELASAAKETESNTATMAKILSCALSCAGKCNKQNSNKQGNDEFCAKIKEELEACCSPMDSSQESTATLACSGFPCP